MARRHTRPGKGTKMYVIILLAGVVPAACTLRKFNIIQRSFLNKQRLRVCRLRVRRLRVRRLRVCRLIVCRLGHFNGFTYRLRAMITVTGRMGML